MLQVHNACHHCIGVVVPSDVEFYTLAFGDLEAL